jgi:hypothetical protein
VFFGRPRVSRHSASSSRSRTRGAERRQTRGCAKPPVSGRRGRSVGRFAKASPPFLRREAPPGAPLRRCATDGPRFRERGPATPVSQLLAAGPGACEQSPAIARAPKATLASGPRRRINRRRGFPDHRPGEVESTSPPLPHRRSVFTASHDDAP